MLGERGQPHAEPGLVHLGAAQGVGQEGRQLGDGGAEAGGVLGGDEVGDGEGVGGAEDLLGGEDAFCVSVRLVFSE